MSEKEPELRSVEFITQKEYSALLGEINLYVAERQRRIRLNEEEDLRKAIQTWTVEYIQMKYEQLVPPRKVVIVKDNRERELLKQLYLRYNNEKIEDMFKGAPDVTKSLISECTDGFVPYKTAKA